MLRSVVNTVYGMSLHIVLDGERILHALKIHTSLSASKVELVAAEVMVKV